MGMFLLHNDLARQAPELAPLISTTTLLRLVKLDVRTLAELRAILDGEAHVHRMRLGGLELPVIAELRAILAKETP
jgi:hypothetical protein